MIGKVEFYKVFGKFYDGEELDLLWCLLVRFNKKVNDSKAVS